MARVETLVAICRPCRDSGILFDASPPLKTVGFDMSALPGLRKKMPLWHSRQPPFANFRQMWANGGLLISPAICQLTLCTTPGRGSLPKCLEPGTPNNRLMLENLILLPPVTVITNGVGETGAGPPLSVTVAIPDN